MRHLSSIALLSVTLSCGRAPVPPAPRPEAPPARRCASLDDVRREILEGSLRRADEALAAEKLPFCAPDEAALLHARVLLDLGRPRRAGEVVARARGHEAERAALGAEIAERARPRTADEIRRAREAFRRGLEAPGAGAEGLFLEAWRLDPPNGLALLHAGLAARRDEGERRAPRLFERGVAELEEETGVPAHAGIAAPPACVGHFSNYLGVEWLPDSAHATVACTDGVVVARVAGHAVERVAQLDHAPSLDVARLPRLAFVAPREAEEDAVGVEADRIRLASGAWSSRVQLPEGHWLQAVVRSRDGRIVFAIARSIEPWWRESIVIPFNVQSGRALGRFDGGGVRELDDGRFAIRGLGGVQIVDRTLAKRAFIAGAHGDLSPDGKRLLFTKPGASDEMYHPVYPWLRDLATGEETDLRPLLLEDGQVHPASIAWPRLAPLTADACAALGTMTSPEQACVHPAVTIGGRSFGSNDDVACHALGDGSGTRSRRNVVACLDPRGPVDAAAPWDPALVCRIGPHVLPLAVCAHLLAR